VRDLRGECEFRDRCGRTGHFQEEGAWRRCKCLQLELNWKKLGPMFTENPKRATKLSKVQDKDLIISGPLESIRQNVARVLLDVKGKYVTMDAYRLIEIFLGLDTEAQSTGIAVDCDLLVLLLGFGDPPNKYLPELVLQVMNRRELIRRPTWIILGLDVNRVAHRYSVELSQKLGDYSRVVVK